MKFSEMMREIDLLRSDDPWEASMVNGFQIILYGILQKVSLHGLRIHMNDGHEE